MASNEEIVRRAVFDYECNDLLVLGEVERVNSGAWVTAKVWVPLPQPKAVCSRVPAEFGEGWVCESTYPCEHRGFLGFCHFDEVAKQEWQEIVYGG